MGFFDSVIDVLKGGASSLDSGFIGDDFGDSNAKDQCERNQQLMNQQGAINENMFRNRYRWTTEDMKAAGLNPILAASGGFSVGSGPSVSLPSQAMAPLPSIPSVATSAKDLEEIGLVGAQIDRQREEKLRVIEETGRVAAEAVKVIEEAEKIRREQNLVSAQERKTVEEVQKTIQEVAELASRTAKNWVDVDVGRVKSRMMKEETENVLADRRVIENNERLLSKKIQQLTYELSELGTVSTVYEGPAGQVLTYIREIIRSLGLLPAIGAVSRALGGTGRAVKGGNRTYNIQNYNE